MAIAKAILNLLESVDQVTTTLSGEKYSTLLWCLPLMFGLYKAAEPEDNDSSTVRSIKTNLTEQLNRRFGLANLEINSPVVLATALDPRFRKLTFLSAEEQLELKSILMDKSVDCDSAVFSTGAAQASEPPTKKQKSVLDHLLGDDDEVELTVTVSDEVNAYFEECHKENSLAWWKSNSC